MSENKLFQCDMAGAIALWLKNECKVMCFIFTALFCASAYPAKKIPAVPEIFVMDSQIYVNDQHIQLRVLNSFSLQDGRVVTQFRQLYQDIPIWNQTVTVSVSPLKFFPTVFGDIVSDLHGDLADMHPKVSADWAQSIAIADALGLRVDDAEGVADGMFAPLQEKGSDQIKRSDNSPTLWVYLDADEQAHLVYLVSWAETENLAIRFYAFVNAVSGAVIERWRESSEDGHSVVM